jgi:hypothetical protein
MSIRDRFNKLIRKEPEPISDYENFRRWAVRDGNLDWQGLPIDRNAGAPISHRSEPRGYRELVNRFLERSGAKIEQRNNHIPVMSLDQFDRDADATELAHGRRFDKRRSRDFESMQEFLRDGAAAPPDRK